PDAWVLADSEAVDDGVVGADPDRDLVTSGSWEERVRVRPSEHVEAELDGDGLRGAAREHRGVLTGERRVAVALAAVQVVHDRHHARVEVEVLPWSVAHTDAARDRRGEARLTPGILEQHALVLQRVRTSDAVCEVEAP